MLYELILCCYFCSVAIKAQNSLLAIYSLRKPIIASFRRWMDCKPSISVIYFLFQISSQMDFLCCPGDYSSLWQPCTPPAVIAWVYYYTEKCCRIYRTLLYAYRLFASLCGESAKHEGCGIAYAYCSRVFHKLYISVYTIFVHRLTQRFLLWCQA